MPAEQKQKTRATLEVDGQLIDEVIEFDYSSDVLAVGDECHFTVSNPHQKYTGSLQIGAKVRLYLSNPMVNGGAKTLKHLGILVERNAEYGTQGSLLRLTTADLGWHLVNCCAPLWYNLRKATYADLVNPTAKHTILDKSFGIEGIRFDNNMNRKLKLGVAAVRAASQRVLDPVFAIQVEPGDTIYDKIAEYSRRLNLLVNVSCDGYLQCFNPNYHRAPKYHLRCLMGSRANQNNIVRSSLYESARTIWTDVECVGEQIGYEGPKDPNNANAEKKRGGFHNPKALPFVHRLTFGDGEMYERKYARKQAEWKYKRGIFDSWYVRYTVAGHYHTSSDRNLWWESDLMYDVKDEELGVDGVLYGASVLYSSNRSVGDTTDIIIRKPGLLSAAFGEIPNPPMIRSSPASRGPAPVQTTDTSTTVKA